jgi:DNA-binding XRE family transcriptional regulator
MARVSENAAPNANLVLGKAAIRAAERLGFSQAELADIIGRDRTTITRSGIDPDSKPGELAKLLIRCYRSLAVMVDDNADQVLHWMRTANLHTGGVPANQVKTVAGLVAVTGYLDAIRGKV